ncbi:MAG: deoxyguanosinetriphosphate triphosphohydrolase [Candidatus Poribacteria bacterium]|nr:deoxyguanosinetriphosphate triphosphohydrolase [Candidatus Poribacteria bacterium]
MTVKDYLEETEDKLLSPHGMRSKHSRGRLRPITPCHYRTEFQRDRDRILHSKAFRRLKGKTQVFLAPKGDHYRTRLTHTLEVAQVARTIARGLRLNEDLTEAIAYGHDLGHTPFGHAGEDALSAFHPDGWNHYEQSLRVVDALERDGEGLNLTHEVREGIGRHSKGRGSIFEGKWVPQTLEGMVVRVSDVTAYLNHDIEDAVRGEVLRVEQLPQEALSTLGKTHGERIGRVVADVIESSADRSRVTMSDAVLAATDEIKAFMYEQVYPSSPIMSEVVKAQGLLKALMEHYERKPETMPTQYRSIADNEGVMRAVCDYVAGMTDDYAIHLYQQLFVPKAWGYS